LLYSFCEWLNGADFICVGMFDWQIVDDVNIALEILPKTKQRQRGWMAWKLILSDP
jgi:hypothetical protein